MDSTAEVRDCPLCSLPLTEWVRERNRAVFHASCRVCGDYSITRDVARYVSDRDFAPKRYLVSGTTRNATARGSKLEITGDNLERLAEAAPVHRTPLRLLDELLLIIADRSTSFTDTVPIEWVDYSLLYLPHFREQTFLLEQLVKLGRLHPLEGTDSIWLVRLTVKGWQRVEQLQERRPRSHQAFVAMWFDSSLSTAWSLGLAPALQASGFAPVRVDQVEHNNRIDDRIVTEIRRSGLVVADFTGHRAGVYFEAGFALGLGIPLIWTCRRDYIDTAHFDTRQYNHIIWDDPGDLHDKLVARIRATVPGAALH